MHMDQTTPRIFRERPWRSISDFTMKATAPVPTMLSRMEQRLYLWLARDWALGEGVIVDLGTFVGGSTARLAEGQRQAGRAIPIHAFDRFGASPSVKELVLYSQGIEPFDGTDILPLSQKLLSPWAPAIKFHKGQIEDQDWDGTKIEILAIDAAKTVKGMDRMAEMFFPSLIPGRSVVVQQDFLHWKVPWIPVQMEQMADWFEPLAVCPRDTVVYLCTKPVDEAALVAGRMEGLSDQDLQDGLMAAADRLAHFAVEDRLVRQSEAVTLNPGARMAKEFKVRPPR